MKNLTSEIKASIFEYADKYKIDRVFLLALVKTESNFNPLAQRYEAAYPYLYSPKELAEVVGCSRFTMEDCQRTSYGLCQVMGAVAYEGGFRGWPAKLFDVEVNLKFACEHIIKLVKKWEVYTHEEMYASYNSGKPRKMDGNVWVNQSAVGRFLRNLEEVKAVD
jgi:soluble lytic murein transglycosylase-like protein